MLVVPLLRETGRGTIEKNDTELCFWWLMSSAVEFCLVMVKCDWKLQFGIDYEKVLFLEVHR